MSLVAFGLRLAAVNAIRAAIWPEFIVADSPQKPIELVEGGRPAVAVYTTQTNDGLEGNEVLAGNPQVRVDIQVFLPPIVILSVAGQSLEFDTREEGADTLLDVLTRRILAAFAIQGEPWSVLWTALSTRTRTVADASYLIETESVRVSARELSLECETLFEPEPGGDPQGVWADLIALMRSDPSPRASVLADWLRGEIIGPEKLTRDERDRILLGLSAKAAQAVSILPIVRGSEIGEVAVTVDGPAGDQVVVPGPASPPTP